MMSKSLFPFDLVLHVFFNVLHIRQCQITNTHSHAYCRHVSFFCHGISGAFRSKYEDIKGKTQMTILFCVATLRPFSKPGRKKISPKNEKHQSKHLSIVYFPFGRITAFHSEKWWWFLARTQIHLKDTHGYAMTNSPKSLSLSYYKVSTLFGNPNFPTLFMQTPLLRILVLKICDKLIPLEKIKWNEEELCRKPVWLAVFVHKNWAYYSDNYCEWRMPNGRCA